MIQKIQKRRGGFTLVEIMIVVAIIALLAAIALPNFLRARKRTQGSTIKEDLRLIDAAVDTYAIEHNKKPGFTVTWDDIKPYLKSTSALYLTGATCLGEAYPTSYKVDSPVIVPTGAQTDLSDVCDAEFWSPFPLK